MLSKRRAAGVVFYTHGRDALWRGKRRFRSARPVQVASLRYHATAVSEGKRPSRLESVSKHAVTEVWIVILAAGFDLKYCRRFNLYP